MATTLPEELEQILAYAKKAVAPENRFDPGAGRDGNFRYLPRIEFAEVGRCGDEPGGFVMEVTIPRHADNELGMSLMRTIHDRAEATEVLRRLAALIDGEG